MRFIRPAGIGFHTSLAVALLAIGAAVLDHPRSAFAQSSMEQQVLPLHTLMPPAEEMKLLGSSDTLDFGIWMGTTERVKSATLKLGYVSTDKIIAADSLLMLSLNGTKLADLPMMDNRQMVRAEVGIPADRFTSGLNMLSLEGWQAHKDGCGTLLESELWTHIDVANSYLVLELERGVASLRLSDVDQAGWTWTPAGSPILIIGAGPVTRAGTLSAGALVAQGYSLRAGDVPLRFRSVTADEIFSGADGDTPSAYFHNLAASSMPRGNHALVGTARELTPFLSTAVIAEINGPFLGLYPRSDDSAEGILVVSGRDETEVLKAARAFADRGTKPQASPSMIVSASATSRPAAPPSLMPRMAYSFSDLHWIPFDDQRQEASLEMRLSPSFFAHDNRKLTLSLSYAYGPKLPAGSRLSVLANGEFASVLPLDDLAGDIVDHRALQIRLASLRPGMNRIDFRLATGETSEDRCAVRRSRGRLVEIFPDSTVELPEFVDMPGRPELNLLRTDAQPLSLAADQPSQVLVARKDPLVVSAAWTLLAKLAQQVDQPLADPQLDFVRHEPSGHLLVIGDVVALDPQLTQPGQGDALASMLPLAPIATLQAAEPAAGPRAEVPDAPAAAIVPVMVNGETLEQGVGRAQPSTPSRDPAGSTAPGSRQLWAEQLRRVDGLGRLESSAESLRQGVVTVLDRFRADLGLAPATQAAAADRPFDGYMSLNRSPYAKESLLAIVAAPTPAQLDQAVAALVQPALWNQIHGGSFAWRDATGETATLPARIGGSLERVAELWTESPEKSVLAATNILAARPMLWLAIALGALLLLASLAALLLEIRDRD